MTYNQQAIMGAKFYLIRVVSHAQLERILTMVRIHNGRVHRAIQIDDVYQGSVPNARTVAREHRELMEIFHEMPDLDPVLMKDGQIAEWACDDWELFLEKVIVNKTQIYLQFVTYAQCEPADAGFAGFGRDYFDKKQPKWMDSDDWIEMNIMLPKQDDDMFETLPTYYEMLEWVRNVSRTDDADKVVSFAANGNRADRAERAQKEFYNIREESKRRARVEKKSAKKDPIDDDEDCAPLP